MKFKDELEKMNATDEEIANAVENVRNSIPGTSHFRFEKTWGFHVFGVDVTEEDFGKAMSFFGLTESLDSDSDVSPPPHPTWMQLADKMNGYLLNKLA